MKINSYPLSNSASPLLNLVRLCSALLLCLSASAVSAEDTVTPGDRHPDTRVVYPEGAFFHNGGIVIDITKPPFNAKGDGKTDDTAAIVKAYDFIVEKIRERIADPSIMWPIADMHTIYFPDGEYLVSDSLVYSGEPLMYRGSVARGTKNEGLNNIRFKGESREGTTIRLQDNSPGFEDGQIKPIVSLARQELNNLQTFNSVENLTIDSGSGNPGAVGVNYAGANKSSMRNLLIRSGDGQGVAGIYILTCPSMGYHADITVEGFRYGIWMYPYHMTHNSFEYITLKGQTQAAIAVDDSTASLRAILVEDCQGPALLMRAKGGQVAVVESTFKGTDSTSDIAAIEFRAGSILARNITTKNYGQGMYSDLFEAPKGTSIDEVTYPAPLIIPLSKAGDSPKTLNLPVEDEPAVLFPKTPDGWALVDDYLSDEEASKEEPDYRQALQDALNSGKAFVLFARQQNYHLSGPVTVPATVEVISSLRTRIHGNSGDGQPTFIIAEDSPKPLTIEESYILDKDCVIQHKAPRTLCIRNSAMRSEMAYENINTQSGVKLFLTAVTGFGKKDGAVHDQKVWARWINTEYPHSSDFPFVSSDVWIFGYKTEKHQTSFSAKKGSRIEILGGVSNQYIQSKYLVNNVSEYPTFLVENSEASIFACTNGPSMNKLFGYKDFIEVVEGDQTWVFEKQDAPKRVGRGNQYFLPLAVVRD